MDHGVNRRQFLTASATAAAALGFDWTRPALAAQGNSAFPATDPPTFRTKLLKATTGSVSEEGLRRLKDAGFDGIEGRRAPLEEAAAMRKVADKLGMRVHSVLYGWARFNSPDRSEVERTFAECEDTLRVAQAYGADAALIVTCQLPAQTASGRRGGGGGRRGGARDGGAGRGEAGRGGARGEGAPAAQAGTRRGGGGGGGGLPFRMPDPWEFQIDFDEKTGHIRSVVYGDNTPYAEYIRLHNHAIDTSTEWVKRLIPLAEKTKVVIAIENVWNHLWVEPRIFTHFVKSFNSPWVKAYYDIGNNIKWAPAEQWVLTIGGLLSKVHVKDFKLDPASPTGDGDWAAIREGSTRWPILRAALDRVNYNGWMTIEAPRGLSLEEQAKRLDMIAAGI
jgi:hexulose-6-phosphate isomerase